MSIRLRLTILYSGIVALTLIVFSVGLYFVQSQATLGTIRANLERQAESFGGFDRRAPRLPEVIPPGTNLPGRWLQIRNADGTIVARSPDLGEATLPLSETGLRTVQNGTPWVETAQVENDPVLVFSQPQLTQGRVTRIFQVAAPIAEREQALNTLGLILIVASALTSLAAFAIGWVLAGMALRPIHQITQTAQTIGAEHDFSQRVQHKGPNDEVGQLATTFNTMLTELEAAYRQVEQALQNQRRFVADASHELRTPLTTIRGNVDLLGRQPPIDDNEQAEVLNDTKDETDRLIRLVNQLLLLARADAGRQLRHEPVAVKPLIEDVCRQAKLLAPNRTIEYDTPFDATVIGDRDALKQVLLVLLDNALVHTPSGTSIKVTAALIDEQIAISVQDTGPGIAPNLLSHIFERFYRGDISRSRGGTGLGLSIAKELMQAQNGTITVTSQLGQGSSFTVTLPQTSRG